MVRDMASHVLAGMEAMTALRRHYEQHVRACCDRIYMESLQGCVAPEIRGVATDLETAHGRADWGT
eukprot:13321075-Alexandrium_andersonii.AAC.1